VTALLFRDDAYLRSCEASVLACDQRGIRLDRTVFYYLSGGQAGDTGVLRTADGREVHISDTLRDAPTGEILHVPAAGSAALIEGEKVMAELDWERRYRLMRLHTCMHLLCAVVPSPVTGGRITPDKAHLDFDLQGLAVDKADIETRLNALIAGAHKAVPRWITDEEMAARPELVRTMSVKPPTGQGRVRLLDIAGVDLQPCGGTHVRNTGEVGPVVVHKIRSEGKRNKRVIVGFAGEAGTQSAG